MPQDRAALIPVLHNIATQLRVDSIRSTTAAESGHPTTCASAADLIAALFFAEMRFDPTHPQHPLNDRFVLSKGHAAPILYAAWAAVGYIKRDDLLNLRKLDSDLEGPSDAAAAVRRRRHWIAGPGTGRRSGIGAERAAHRIGLPDLRAARRRRNGRGLGVGSGESSRHSRRWTTSSASLTSIASVRADRRCGSTTWMRWPGAGAPSAGTPSSSTATI